MQRHEAVEVQNDDGSNGLCMRTKNFAKISRIQRAIEDDGEKHRSMRRHRVVVVSGRWSVNVKDIYAFAIRET